MKAFGRLENALRKILKALRRRLASIIARIRKAPSVRPPESNRPEKPRRSATPTRSTGRIPASGGNTLREVSPTNGVQQVPPVARPIVSSTRHLHWPELVSDVVVADQQGAGIRSNASEAERLLRSSPEEFNRWRASQNYEPVLLEALELEGENLQGVDWTGCVLVNVDLSGANLSHGNFAHAVLHQVQFEQADVSGVAFGEHGWDELSGVRPDLRPLHRNRWLRPHVEVQVAGGPKVSHKADGRLKLKIKLRHDFPESLLAEIRFTVRGHLIASATRSVHPGSWRGCEVTSTSTVAGEPDNCTITVRYRELEVGSVTLGKEAQLAHFRIEDGFRFDVPNPLFRASDESSKGS